MFLRYFQPDSVKSEESMSVTPTGWGFFNNVSPSSYEGINCCPAKARLIFIVKRKCEYPDSFRTRLLKWKQLCKDQVPDSNAEMQFFQDRKMKKGNKPKNLAKEYLKQNKKGNQ